MNPAMTTAELAAALGKSIKWIEDRIGPASIVCSCYAFGADNCRVHQDFLEAFYSYGDTCTRVSS